LNNVGKVIHNAEELLKSGEKAIAIFTTGDRFIHDPTGKGRLRGKNPF